MKADELEAAYLETALRTRSRDVKAANRACDELHDLKNQMRVLLPDGGEATLKRFATHPYVEVRMWACAHLLAIDEPFALNELRNIEDTERGLASLTAEYTIKEWRAGKLTDHLK